MIEVEAFLIDLDGVLYVDKEPVPGAADLMDLLQEKGYPYRFVSNTTTKSRRTLAEFLGEMGFEIPEEQIFTPSIAAVELIRSEEDKSCYLIAKDDAQRDFERAGITIADEDVDYVIIGDAEEDFTFDRLNRAFRLVMNGASIVALEKDKYWMASDGLNLSAGPFVAALEYATGDKAQVVGKPTKGFFEMALSDLGVSAQKAAMIGDDINTDVGGAQSMGMKGILVKTGKYREEVMAESGVLPDVILESIAELRERL